MKNKRLTFDKLVQKRMFLLMILSLVFFGYFGEIQNVGINKTVGWAWDITSWLFFAKSYFIPIYVIGYGILALLKWWTHKNLSKAHLILVILTFILDDLFTIDIRLIITMNLISMTLFVTNLIWAIRNRNKPISADFQSVLLKANTMRALKQKNHKPASAPPLQSKANSHFMIIGFFICVDKSIPYLSKFALVYHFFNLVIL